MKEIKGIITPMTTPYKDNGNEVDYEGLERNIAFLIENGVHSLMVNGGTGEYVSLTPNERIKIAEVAAKKIDGKASFVVGVTAETTREAIMYAQHAESVGADAMMLAVPYYCQPNWEMIQAHFKAVCGSVKLPMICYNNPFTTGIDIGLEHLIDLLNEIENFVYVKDSTGSVQRMRNVKRDGPAKTKTLVGWDDLGLEGLFAGGQGWFCVASNSVPELSVAVYNAFEKNDYKTAWEKYECLLPFLRYLEDSGKLIPASKYASDLRGLAGGPNRAPRLELSPDDKELIKEYLRRMNILHL